MMALLQNNWKKIGIFTGLVWGLIMTSLLFRRWLEHHRPPRHFRADGISQQIQGLTEEQAAALLPSTVDEVDNKTRDRAFMKSAIRQIVFTIFNFNLFAMMVVNLFLGNPWGFLLNLVLFILNVALRTYQLIFTKHHMDRIIDSLKPYASVIRDGQLRSIDPENIVPGDAVIVNEGDEIQVAGSLIGEESITVEHMGPSGTVSKTLVNPGESLPSGTYCVKGRGIYISKEGGWARHRYKDGYRFELLKSKRTPLQRLIETLLFTLLGIVVILSIILITDEYFASIRLVNNVYRAAFSIIFGVAPTSLFMMLILNNAVSVFHISQLGALVYNPQSIETLAQVRTVCISKETLVGDLNVTLKIIESQKGKNILSENIIRHILGDLVHSIFIHNTRIQKLAEALPGESRKVKEKAPFWDTLGWFGATFEDTDRRGTYILGRKEILTKMLERDKSDVRNLMESTVSSARNGMIKFFEKESPQNPEQENPQKDHSIVNPSEYPDSIEKSESIEVDPDITRSSMVQRMRATFLHWLKPIEGLEENKAEQAEQPDDKESLLLLYRPKSVSLYDRNGSPHLPRDLIPLATVHVNETVPPETLQSIKTLLDDGIQIKILTADPPERVSHIARELGIPDDEISMISGPQMDDGHEHADILRDTLIFGNLTPTGKERIVKALQELDGHTMMIGSSVSDIRAMKQALLGVVPRSATQAAIQLADIVLLDESIGILPGIIAQGQRTINGVLTTFKVQLSHVLMQLLLILLILFSVLGQFPYQSAQAGVITTFTIVIPNVFLVVWASAKRLTIVAIRQQLLNFIIPVGLTLTILVSGISIYFNNFDSNPKNAHFEVAYFLLLAGWIRVFFAQPPHSIWAGGTSLRGDLRIYRVVFGSALLLIAALLFPFFRKSFQIGLLSSWADLLIIVASTLIWMFVLKI